MFFLLLFLDVHNLLQHPVVQQSFNNSSSSASNSNNSGSSDSNKQPQPQKQSGSAASPTCTNISSPDEVDKNASNKPQLASLASSSSSAKVSSQKRKRSHSDSKSRSHSPTPNLLARGKNAKRKKSADDGKNVVSHSYSKEGTTAKSSSVTNSTASDAMVDVPVNLPVPRGPSIFTFDPNSSHVSGSALAPQTSQKSVMSVNISSSTANTSSSELVGAAGGLLHIGSTLDDLCRAAAELERMETPGDDDKEKELNAYLGGEEMDEYGRKRPKNITIPHVQTHSQAIEREKNRLGGTPPYTPPPILSPSRSVMHLAPWVGPVNLSTPCTPNRIIQNWSSRRSTDGRNISESEENRRIPHINIGDGYQAFLPKCDGKG